MERREQFLDIVKPFSLNSEIALKYALHLEELFDKILPKKYISAKKTLLPLYTDLFNLCPGGN